MPQFTYTARAVNGDLKSATLEAPNRDEVVKQLRQQRLNVLKIDEGTAVKKKRGGKIKMRDIVIFTRQFSTMINAGLPLVQALDILATQSENPALKDVTRQVVFDVESGNTVADALRKQPKAFSDLYVNMVAAGEAGGILDTILMRLAVFMEEERRTRSQGEGRDDLPWRHHERRGDRHHDLARVRHPDLLEHVRQREHSAAASTRLVIGLSHALKTYWWVVIVTVFGLFTVIRKYYATNDGKLQIDRLLLKAPVLVTCSGSPRCRASRGRSAR